MLGGMMIRLTLRDTRHLVPLIVAAAIGSATVIAGQTPKPAPPAKAATAKGPEHALPAAVEAAFRKAYPNATVKNVSKEKVKGQEEYEIESIDNGLARDLNYKADGTLILYEEQVTEAMVPAAVVSAIKARYPKATLTRTEKLFKDGTVTYEIGLKGAKPGEVILTADGKWVSPK
jgi:hypothetical protein